MQDDHPTSVQSPFVSVIMAVRNEENYIEQSLNAVFRQNYLADRMEVIVADGMSTDRTVQIVRQTGKKTKIPLKIVENPGQTAATGLNLGINTCQGEIIVRVDGHTIIESDYLRECVAALERTEACNVGGRMIATADNTFGRAVALATSSPFGVGTARFHYSDKEEMVDTVYLGAWRRKVFEAIGLFNENLTRNQDDEFNYRLRARGGKILLSPKIKSHYYNRSTWRGLWRQYYQYGFWKVPVMQLHPRQMSWRQFVPALFVLALVSGALTTLFFWQVGLWLLSAILGVYLLTAIIFTFRIFASHSYKIYVLLPLCYLSLHLSYGMGFLFGLFYFWRWFFKKQKNNTVRPKSAFGEYTV